MSAADWYARKLGRGAPAAPVAPRTSTPPTGPAPWAPQPYQPTPQQGTPYQAQQPEVHESEVTPGEGSWFQQMAQRGAAGKNTPTKKAKEIYTCPNCGSNNFFTRASTASRGPAPAPLCTECGYNGMFEQFGNQPAIKRGDVVSVEAVIAEINKTLGEGTVYKGSEIRDKVLPRITSGSLALDWSLGGGWAANQWNEIVGDESSGKTAMVYMAIAANQRLDPEHLTVWIAAEEFVHEYAEMWGVDTGRLIIIDTNVMEEAYDAAIKFLDSHEIDCLVIDSLPQLIPEAEDEGSMEDFQVGLAARLNGKFFRKGRKALKRSQTIEVGGAGVHRLHRQPVAREDRGALRRPAHDTRRKGEGLHLLHQGGGATRRVDRGGGQEARRSGRGGAQHQEQDGTALALRPLRLLLRRRRQRGRRDPLPSRAPSTWPRR